KYAVVRFAENVVLAETARQESHWDVVGTSRGSLIRAKNGAFRGWYLAADESILPTDQIQATVGFGSLRPAGPSRYARNLILVERVTDSCYWKFEANESPPAAGARPQPADTPSYSIRSAAGKYESWSLSFLPSYFPEQTGNARIAWNLILVPPETPSYTPWRHEETLDGTLIRVASPGFKGWVLDYLEDAKVIERMIWEEVEPKQRQAPPLAHVVK
ncbi:MAG: hypothetical protein AAF517_03550, partial [Planctomycetota bacterium]